MTALIVDFPNRHEHVSMKVRFSKTKKVMLFERHAKSDATSLWYTGRDLKLMKTSYKRNVLDTNKRLASLVSREVSSIEELDFFGIENMLTPELIKKKIAQRKSCWDAVLKEQDRQYHSDEFDARRLARVAQESTQWAVGRAHVIGILQSNS